MVRAYEAAYRFVWQYYGREQQSESLALMLVSMEPVDDHAKTSDPASWQDWQRCVAEDDERCADPSLPPLNRSTREHDCYARKARSSASRSCQV